MGRVEASGIDVMLSCSNCYFLASHLWFLLPSIIQCATAEVSTTELRF